MAARARRFFIFCFLLITPTALLMYFQQYGSRYYNNPIKRLHSARNHVEETSELLDAFDKERNFKARMQEVLKTESMNNMLEMVQPSGTSVSVQRLPLSDLSFTQAIYCFVFLFFS